MKTADAVILKVLAGVQGAIPATKLVKLVYFVDYIYFQHFGRTLTGFQYQWDHYGPNALGHAIIAETEALVRKDLAKLTMQSNIHGSETKLFELREGTDITELDPEAEIVLNDVISQYGRLSVQSITAKSKQTAPFIKAAQYSLLTMERLAPAGKATERDWDAFERDLKENGTISLDDVKRRYGLE